MKSCVEVLECRIAPAGLVMVTVSGGNLTIAGDAEGNAIEVGQVEGTSSYFIRGVDSETFVKLGAGGDEVSELQVDGITGNVLMNLGKGNDEVLVSGGFAKNVTVNLGTGINVLTLEELSVVGNVLVTGGNEQDSVGFEKNVRVEGNLTTSLGAGNNIWTSADLLDFSIGKNLAMNGGSGTDTALLDVGTANITGNFVVQFGNGLNNFAVKADSFFTGGNLQYKGGAGMDFVEGSAEDFLVGGRLLVSGGGDGNKTVFNASDILRVNGDVIITNGGNRLDFEFCKVEFSGTNLEFGRNFSVTNANGMYETIITATDVLEVFGNMQIKNGKGLAFSEGRFEYSGSSAEINGADVRVGGNFSIINGKGEFSNVLEATHSLEIGKNILVKNGDMPLIGTTTYIYASTIEVGGDVKIVNGNGAFDNYLEASSSPENPFFCSVHVEGSVIIQNGNNQVWSYVENIIQADSIFIGANININNAAGQIKTKINAVGWSEDVEADVSVGGSIIVTNKLHPMGHRAETLIASDDRLHVAGGIRIFDDAMNGPFYKRIDADEVIVGGSIVARGNDVLEVEATTMEVGGNVAVTEGLDLKCEVLNIAGNVIMSGTMGKDSFRMEAGGVIQGKLIANFLNEGAYYWMDKGNLYVDAFGEEGLLTVNGGIAVTADTMPGEWVTQSGYDYVQVYNPEDGKYHWQITPYTRDVLEGEGDVLIQIHRVQAGSISIQGGGGNEEVKIADSSVTGSVVINAGVGGGIADVNLKTLNIGKTLNIVSFDGSDLIVGENLKVEGTVMMDTGAGDDKVQIEKTENPLLGGALFYQPVTIKLGAGKDTLYIGVASNNDQQAAFNKSVQLDGGEGAEDKSSIKNGVFNISGQPVLSGFEV